MPIIEEDNKLELFTKLFVAVVFGNYFISFIDKV
jgi:hypothetical protein